MPLEEDILSFKTWANRLTFPMEDMPSEDALKSIFKSRQSLLFINIMEKVRPRQTVEEVRRNILLHKMEKLRGQIVPACTWSFLPREMQRYLKIKELKKQKLQAENKLMEVKGECDTLSTVIKNKNVQKLKLKHKQDSLEIRNNILELKFDSLDEEINKENGYMQQMKTYMPIKINSSNASESKAINAVADALKDLEKFYQIFLNNSKSNCIREAREELWKKLRHTFTNIPNYLLWTIILKLKDEQLHNITLLNKSTITEFTLTDDKMSSFDIKFLKAQARIISIFAKYVDAKKDSENSDKRFQSVYEQFVWAVQQKVNMFGNQSTEDSEEIISDYLVQYNTRSFNKGQNESLANEIENCKAQIEEGNRILNDHVVLLGSIREIYAKIETLVRRIEQEMTQLNQISEKILYTKSVLQFMFKDIQSTQTSFTMNKTRMNSTDSFDISDNVFCSTKLDFEHTANMTIRSDVTMINTGNVLPQHLLELSTFMDTPIDKLNCKTKECNLYLSPNPLVLELSESVSTIQLAPGLLLTPEGVIQEVKNRCDWDSKLREIATELKVNINLVEVDQIQLKNRKKEQREQMAELLDKIDVSGVNVNRTLAKCAKYYNFFLANSLKNYIPNTKLFNNQTYADYESEYQMYYRMATSGASITH